MKKFASVVLIAATLFSLTCVTVFAQGDTIDVTFTPPQVGDAIQPGYLTIGASSNSLTITHSFTGDIYDGSTAESLSAVNTYAELTAFYEANVDKKHSSGNYTAKSYVVIISVYASPITANTTFTFADGVTGGTLCTNDNNTCLYGYINFTPSGGTSSLASQSQSADVLATYQEPEAPETVYSVNISFDSMKFIYTAESRGTWNSTLHKYENPTPASWSFANNSITVTNHSNVPVTASFSYAATPEFSNVVNGSFTDDSKDPLPSNQIGLSSADDTSVGAMTSTTVYLLLSGDLPSGTSAETKCGTVTVTIQ